MAEDALFRSFGYKWDGEPEVSDPYEDVYIFEQGYEPHLADICWAAYPQGERDFLAWLGRPDYEHPRASDYNAALVAAAGFARAEGFGDEEAMLRLRRRLWAEFSRASLVRSAAKVKNSRVPSEAFSARGLGRPARLLKCARGPSPGRGPDLTGSPVDTPCPSALVQRRRVGAARSTDVLVGLRRRARGRVVTQRKYSVGGRSEFLALRDAANLALSRDK